MQGQTVRIVSQAIRYIEEHLHEKMDLDIGNRMGISLILLKFASARLSSVSKRSSYAVSSILLSLFLANLCHLLSELLVSGGYFAAFVIGKNAFSLCGGFYCTDGMGNLGIKHFNPLPIGTLYRCGYLLRDVRAWHYHRH